MLTAEIIQANETLKTLSDDQIKAVIELHTNQYKTDSKKEIDAAIGELHRRYDIDFKEVTGKERPEGKKTYEFIKEEVRELKAQLEEAKKGNKSDSAIKAELEKTKAEFETYKSKSIESADARLKHQLATTEQLLKDHEATIAKLQKDVSKHQKENEKILGEKDASLVQLQTDYAFSKALQGVKFRSHIGESVVNTVVDAQKNAILSQFTPEVIKGKDGKEFIQFRDKATGDIALNPANYQNPYTPSELLTERLSKLEIIDKGRHATGGGTGAGGAGGGGVSLDSVRAARTKPEADRAILGYLNSQKIDTSHPEFNTKFQELRNEHKVAELPES